MVRFVIVGKMNCVNYFHAIHVADYLKKHLPSFYFTKHEKEEEEWKEWLNEMNARNKWYVSTSPIIWREITRSGGKPYLIGSLSEFWEYCFDYYGLESKVSKSDLLKLIEDHRLLSHDSQKIMQIITILGAYNDLTELMLLEINDALDEDCDDVTIRLYEDLDDVETAEFLLDLVEEASSYLTKVKSISIMASFNDALKDCDLLLIITDYSRKPEEDFYQWLERCNWSMVSIAEDINYSSQRNLRVILSHRGPVCFNATILMQNCTSIKLSNIVAVTADEALPAIARASKLADIPVRDICGPPVWGFSGISSFTDIVNTVIRADVYRPYKRALTGPDYATLPKGTTLREVRLLSSAIEDEGEVLEEIQALGSKTRDSLFAKARATGSLVKLWLAKTSNDAIISLGVCSNGSFGFPAGKAFSQPVMLREEDKIWRPFGSFPVSSTAKSKTVDMFLELEPVFRKFNIKS